MIACEQPTSPNTDLANCLSYPEEYDTRRYEEAGVRTWWRNWVFCHVSWHLLLNIAEAVSQNNGAKVEGDLQDIYKMTFKNCSTIEVHSWRSSSWCLPHHGQSQNWSRHYILILERYSSTRYVSSTTTRLTELVAYGGKIASMRKRKLMLRAAC